MRKAIHLFLTATVYADSCENSHYQYPYGIPNPSGTDSVTLSNIWTTSEFVLAGGMQNAQELMATSETRRNSDGIPFMIKQSLFGQTLWFKFYSCDDARNIVNVAYSSAETAVVSQFSSGIFSKIDPETGEIIAAIQIANIGDSDGELWSKKGSELSSDGSYVFFLSGLQVDSSTEYRFELFKIQISDFSLEKHIYIGASSSSYGHFGPTGICRLNTADRFVVVGSVATDTSQPNGVIMILNSDLGFVSQSKGIWKMDDSSNYVKPTAVRCSSDSFFVGHNAIPKTSADFPDFETGTGTLASIREFSWVEGTTEVQMEDWEIALSTTGEDVCDTFEVGTSSVYWFCTLSEASSGTVNPFVLKTSYPGNAYENAIFLNWAQSLTSASTVDTRIIIHTSSLQGDVIYFGGTTLQLLGSATDRFAFVSSFDGTSSGCHIQNTAQTSSIDLSSFIEVEQELVYSNFGYWTDLTQTALSATVTDLVVADTFSQYPMALAYQLADQVCTASLTDQDSQRVEVWRTNESTYSFSLSFPQTRTFALDSSTCDEDDPQAYLVDGTEVTSATTPFTFDGSELSFSSDDEDEAGIFEFPALNLKVIVVDAHYDQEVDYTKLIKGFVNTRANELADKRKKKTALNIDKHAPKVKTGIKTGAKNFTSKAIFYAGYQFAAENFYFPKVVALPPQYKQTAPNEPPFFNIIEENSKETIMIGNSYIYTPPYIRDDSPFTFQDLQVTKNGVTVSIRDPTFAEQFPNIKVLKRSLHPLPKLQVLAVDVIPLTIEWNWAEMATKQLYSISNTFSLSFYKPGLSKEELAKIAYDNFMKAHIKDFKITDKVALYANMTAESYFGEVVIKFSSNFSMPFNTLENLQETRMTVSLNGVKKKVKLERRDLDKIVMTLNFTDPYAISSEDEIEVKFSQQDTFVSMSSGMILKQESLKLTAKLKLQLSSSKFFTIKDEAKKTVKVLLIIVLAISAGTSWMSNLFSMISLAQFITLMPIVELNYPKSTLLYFEGISGINLQFLGIQEALDWIIYSGSGYAPEAKMQTVGFKTHALIFNLADIILICFILLFKFIVISILKSCLNEKKQHIDFFKKEAQKFKGPIQFEIIQISYSIILLSSILSIQAMNERSVLEWFSTALAFTFLICLVALPAFFAILTDRIHKLGLHEDKDFLRVFGPLYLDLDFKRQSSLAFGPIVMFMRLIYLLVILYIPDAPEMQLTICMYIMGYLFFTILFVQPYKSGLRNLREGFILFFAICMIGSLWSFGRKKDYETKKKGEEFFIVGTAMLFFFSICLFLYDMFKQYFYSILCRWYESESEELVVIKPQKDIFGYLNNMTDDEAIDKQSHLGIKTFPRYQKGLHDSVSCIQSPLPRSLQASNVSNKLLLPTSQIQQKSVNRQQSNNVKIMDDVHPEDNTYDEILPDRSVDKGVNKELKRIQKAQEKSSEYMNGEENFEDEEEEEEVESQSFDQQDENEGQGDIKELEDEEGEDEYDEEAEEEEEEEEGELEEDDEFEEDDLEEDVEEDVEEEARIEESEEEEDEAIVVKEHLKHQETQQAQFFQRPVQKLAEAEKQVEAAQKPAEIEKQLSGPKKPIEETKPVELKKKPGQEAKQIEENTSIEEVQKENILEQNKPKAPEFFRQVTVVKSQVIEDSGPLSPRHNPQSASSKGHQQLIQLSNHSKKNDESPRATKNEAQDTIQKHKELEVKALSQNLFEIREVSKNEPKKLKEKSKKKKKKAERAPPTEKSKETAKKLSQAYGSGKSIIGKLKGKEQVKTASQSSRLMSPNLARAEITEIV